MQCTNLRSTIVEAGIRQTPVRELAVVMVAAKTLSLVASRQVHMCWYKQFVMKLFSLNRAASAVLACLPWPSPVRYKIMLSSSTRASGEREKMIDHVAADDKEEDVSPISKLYPSLIVNVHSPNKLEGIASSSYRRTRAREIRNSH